MRSKFWRLKKNYWVYYYTVIFHQPPSPLSKLNVMKIENNGYLCFKNNVEWHYNVFTNSPYNFSPCILISPLTSYIFLESYLPLDCLSLNRHFIFPCFLYIFFFFNFTLIIFGISHLIEFILFLEYSYLHYYRMITIFLVRKSFN